MKQKISIFNSVDSAALCRWLMIACLGLGVGALLHFSISDVCADCSTDEKLIVRLNRIEQDGVIQDDAPIPWPRCAEVYGVHPDYDAGSGGGLDASQFSAGFAAVPEENAR